MKFRLGLVIGFGAGYYLGSMAGRSRYEQINRMIGRVKRSDAFEEVADKAKAAVDLGVERAKDLVDSKTGGNNGSSPKTQDLQGAPAPY